MSKHLGTRSFYKLRSLIGYLQTFTKISRIVFTISRIANTVDSTNILSL
nr:MAG TPA: hypothetical protein [Caudoviricetes sp.]